MSHADEQEWAEKLKSGDPAAVQEFARRNVFLVTRIAEESPCAHMDTDDLIQEGNVAMLEELHKKRFDARYRFNTYIVPWICMGMRKANERRYKQKHISSLYAKQVTQKWNEAEKHLCQGNTAYTEEDVCASIGYSRMHAVKIRATRLGHRSGQTTLKQEDAHNECPQNTLIRKEEHAMVRKAVAALPEREREIICRLFGFTSQQETRGELAEDMGISRERVRQLQERAMEQVRRMFTGALPC
ncbi:MAG: sigma-70 family RNA polymerase sigma factor [Candidatus Peribacteraceae bacterium]|nr:sigma-70 family RNA polymerase sigma factor [Candidatus Peribacteraceae bacterium]